MNQSNVRNHFLHTVLGIVLPILLLAAGGALLYSVQKPEPPKVAGLGDDPASLLSLMPAAQVEQVRALTEPLDLTASGVVVPYREIDLAAEVAGRVVEKDSSVRQGNHIKEGQTLLVIDSRDYELDVDRLTQRLEAEKVSLAENEQEIGNVERLVELAEAQFLLAEADFERTKQLGQNFASQSELGSAKQSVLSAMNQKVTLENQMRTLRTKAQRLELAIRMGETELAQAKLNLQRTAIHSPVDGVVVSEQVEKDSYVQRGMSLLKIEDNSKVEISCSLRMDQLYWILDQATNSHDRAVNNSLATMQKLPKIDAIVRFQVSGRQSLVYEWEGRLDRIEGTGMDPQSRMVPIRILVDNPDEYQINGQASSDTAMSLVRGMFVEVTLKARPATQLVLVPKSSVKPATDSYRIWKFDPDLTAFQIVRKRQGFADADSESSRAVAESEGPVPTQVSERNSEPLGTAQALESGRPDPSEWQAGFLRVMEGVEVLGPYHGTKEANTEYWICDAAGSGVLPGDYVIVTPIPGIDTDKTPIRVAKHDFNPAAEISDSVTPTSSSSVESALDKSSDLQ